MFPTFRMLSKPRWAAKPSARFCKASSVTTWWCVTRRLSQYERSYREHPAAGALGRAGVAGATCATCKSSDGASEIYREGNSRYVAIKYSVPVRDLGSTVEEAIAKVDKQVKLPPGYHIDWAGEYESQKRSQKRLLIVLPHHDPGDLHDSLHDVQIVQMGAADSGQRRHGAHRRTAGAAVHQHSFQRFLGRGIPGAVRRRGADRRDHARVHQSIARARKCDSDAAVEGPCCGCGPS